MTATLERPGHWTISRYHLFTQCPFRYYLRHIEKHDEGPKSEALDRGIRTHDKLEKFFLGKGPLPRVAKEFAEEYLNLRVAGVVPEQLWTFTKSWKPTKQRGWLVMKTDLYKRSKNEALVVDFKTGKIYDKNIEQMEVYAAGSFAKWPALQHVRVELHYLDKKHIKEGEFTRKQGVELRAKWTELGNNLLATTEFPPRPSPLCGWCPYAGKQCRFAMQT